jgi:hypothetical protein
MGVRSIMFIMGRDTSILSRMPRLLYFTSPVITARTPIIMGRIGALPIYAGTKDMTHISYYLSRTPITLGRIGVALIGPGRKYSLIIYS